MTPFDYTEDREIQNTSFGRPHVLLLGAGASYAAFPNGDKNGRKLPLLKDFVDILALHTLVKEAGFDPPYNDFEAIYSAIALDEGKKKIREEIDFLVLDYFEHLELPDEPTLYDRMVLSMRPKDVIATFNWDPFLWNAARRNRKHGGTPCLLFLHGNAAIARCENCETVQVKNRPCSSCGRELKTIPMLYPVSQKNYNSDPAIAGHWRTLQRALKVAWAFTIFGYSAPKTDIEAISLLKDGWGEKNDRELEEIEIIDILKEDQLRSSWKEFIHTHHYTTVKTFNESYIGSHPRRSCEALWSMLMECQFLDRYPIPDNLSFDEIYDWLKPRFEAERKNEG